MHGSLRWFELKAFFLRWFADEGQAPHKVILSPEFCGRLDGEACSTPAAGGGLWVGDLEGLTHEICNEVDLRAGHVLQGDAVDQNGCAQLGKDEVILFLLIDDVILILKT